ncbi:hypothetical protein HispidOSU_003914, partial [Sigmodon hispidus]
EGSLQWCGFRNWEGICGALGSLKTEVTPGPHMLSLGILPQQQLVPFLRDGFPFVNSWDFSVESTLSPPIAPSARG